MALDKQEIALWFQGLQDRICQQLEAFDGKATFQEDAWTREAGGGGRSRVITEGNVLEKGGVNFSAVEGPTPEKILNALKLDQADFFATGVSIVLHPSSPKVPIIHMNVRYFEMSNGIWWFGGGIDLTPIYVIEEDAKHFHQQLKAVCDKHHADYYPKFKPWADDYFYLPHRKETRGIGGIFFDRLSGNDDFTKEERWKFLQDVGELFAPLYIEIAGRHKDETFTEEEKGWQLLRRSRYVEFNLLHDKGTKFGLDTDGRTESILMSMPPLAKWEYCHTPAPNSPEEKTQSLLKKGIDFAGM